MAASGGTAAALGLAPYVTVCTLDSDARQHAFSPFATKLLLRLRYGAVPYDTAVGSRGEAPKGKIPYVRFLQGPLDDRRQAAGSSAVAGYEVGKVLSKEKDVVGDTAIITRRLIAEGKLRDLMQDRTATERARDLCIRTMVEDRMYYMLVYERWYLSYTLMRDRGPFTRFSPLLRRLICGPIWAFSAAMLYFQGCGRLTADEMRVFRDECLGALAALVEEAYEKRKDDPGPAEPEVGVGEPFWLFGGDDPTEADFTVFGYLAGACGTPTQPETTRFVAANAAMMEYIMRIHNKYFPDFKDPRGLGAAP